MRKNKSIWLYGLPNTGKTVIANELIKHIDNCILIEGVDIRKYFPDVNYNSFDRRKIMLKQELVCNVLIDKGFNIVSCSVSQPSQRNKNVAYVKLVASFRVRKERDSIKNIYKNGDINNVIYKNSDFTISTNDLTVNETVDLILKVLKCPME